MSTPINKEHDAEYWRRRYENARTKLREILRACNDEESSFDDIVNDVEVTAYRALYK